MPNARTPPPKRNAGRAPPQRDEIQVPSTESGGIPEPTAEYLKQAEETEPTRLTEAQPLLLVIDLNGTLLHRPNRQRAPKEFVGRPHAEAFLNYCIKHFWVVIWSSAQPDNVRVMCSKLTTPAAMEGLVAVWGRDRFGLTPDDYRKRVQCYKRLSSLWANPAVAQSHPQYTEGGRWSQANTVLIDDSSEKARSEPFNLLLVPEFAEKGEHAAHGDILPDVHDYLNELCFVSDVSAYVRANAFRPRTIETPPPPPPPTKPKNKKRKPKRKMSSTKARAAVEAKAAGGAGANMDTDAGANKGTGQ